MATDNSFVLVTGASGYIASYVIKLLQEEGWKVRGTVRSLSNEEVVSHLKELVPTAQYPLELVEADLLKPDSWKAAVEGITHVIHVASPFPDRIPSNPDDLIRPAVDGTLSVLKAASEAGSVKRIVLTSSIAAVFDTSIEIPKEHEESKTFDEESWTQSDDPLLDTYAKSKVLAEKAAWDFIKELPEDKKIELSVVNPGMVIGPLLSKRYTTSHALIKRLLDKFTPAFPKLNVNITDVRDVALAHLRALTLPEAVGKRHLIVNHNVWVKDISAILAKEFRPQGYHVPTLRAPNVLVWVSSFVDKGVRMVVPRLGREVRYDNKRMVDVLNVTPTDLEKTILDTANSMIEKGIIRKPRKQKKPKEPAAETGAGDAEAAKTNGDVSEEKEAKGELEPEDKETKKPEVNAPVAPEIAAN